MKSFKIVIKLQVDSDTRASRELILPVQWNFSAAEEGVSFQIFSGLT